MYYNVTYKYVIYMKTCLIELFKRITEVKQYYLSPQFTHNKYTININ